MSVKKVGIRLQPEGGSETISEVRKVETAIDGMNQSAVDGAARAEAATKRQVDGLRAAALAAAQTETALQRQINAATGVSRGGNLNAAVSARALGSADAVYERRAAQLKAELDPAAAAQDRLNAEIAEYNALAARQLITTEQAAQAQAMAKARYDQTARALEGVTGKYREAAAAAREEAAAAGAQSSYNRILGVRDGGGGGAARESAAIFAAEAEAMDRLEARSRALKAALDPLAAAQDHYNDELRENDQLLKANLITTDQHSRAQALAARRLQETTLQLDRQNRGLTRNTLNSRLNLARQGADVFTTAAMGMNPGMIAIQQGPQILDAWATSGIKLGGPLVMLTGLVGGLAAAVGVMGAAWWSAEKSTLAYEQAATGMGRTAGLTGAQLKAAAEAGAEAGEVSLKSARDQAAAYVSTGKIGGEIISGLIALNKDYAAFAGTDSVKATEALAKAFVEPDKAAREMTRQFGLMDQETLKTIDSLMEQGKRLEAQKILLEELSGAMGGHGDRVSEVTSFWDSATRAMSNYWTKLGEWLHTTQDEKIANLELRRDIAKTPMARQAAERGLFVETFLRDWNARTASDQAADAARNQAAQETKDRADAKKKPKGDSGKAQREAERLAREALQRQRREEDREAGLQSQIAQATQNFDLVRSLEAEERVRRRIRELVDDGTNEAEARTKAQVEEFRLSEAVAAQSVRETAEIGRQVDLEVMRLRGEERYLALATDRADLQKRVLDYQQKGLDLATATTAALADQLQLTEARALAQRRLVDEAEAEHRLNLARLSGDEATTRYLEVEDRISRRARQIEAREKLNRGEGEDRAMSEIQEELDAEALGARRSWVRGLLQDVKRGGIGNAVFEQLDRASDRWVDRLADSLAGLNWSGFLSGLFGGKGGDGGGFAGAFATLFGGHSTGTAFSEGGLKWVGERGPELINVKRGSEVYEHNRSMQMAGRGGNAVIQFGGLTVINHGKEALTGSLRQDGMGGLELLLEPIIDGQMAKRGRDGSLRKAVSSGPQPIRR